MYKLLFVNGLRVTHCTSTSAFWSTQCQVSSRYSISMRSNYGWESVFSIYPLDLKCHRIYCKADFSISKPRFFYFFYFSFYTHLPRARALSESTYVRAGESSVLHNLYLVIMSALAPLSRCDLYDLKKK